MTCTEMSSPTRWAAAAPASVAALTAPTSPRTKTVTRPPPISSLPTRVTFAALTMASAASTEPISPRVSIMPRAWVVFAIFVTSYFVEIYLMISTTEPFLIPKAFASSVSI